MLLLALLLAACGSAADTVATGTGEAGTGDGTAEPVESTADTVAETTEPRPTVGNPSSLFYPSQEADSLPILSIDTFEEQLIGTAIGEEKEVNVTFPEEYQAKELAGKPAMFKVTVKEIKVKELPDVDDEFAQEVSEFETLAEYKEDIKKQITERKEKQALTQKEDAVIEKIVENAQMEIPQPMIDTQVRQMTDEFVSRLQQQGLSVEQYMQLTGLTPDKLKEQMEPQALKRIQSRLVLEAVVDAEKIQISDEKLDAEIEKMAGMYQMEPEKLKEVMGDVEKKQMKRDIAVQEAVTFVTDAAVEVK